MPAVLCSGWRSRQSLNAHTFTCETWHSLLWIVSPTPGGSSCTLLLWMCVSVCGMGCFPQAINQFLFKQLDKMEQYESKAFSCYPVNHLVSCSVSTGKSLHSTHLLLTSATTDSCDGRQQIHNTWQDEATCTVNVVRQTANLTMSITMQYYTI